MKALEKRYHLLLRALIMIMVITAGESNGQPPSAGEVFVANDYRSTSTGQTIVVKWLANKVYYPEGFNVYRKTNNEGDWIKINPAPIKVQTEAPQAAVARDKEVKLFLDAVNKTDYAEFQNGLPKVFVAIKAILNPEFAELLGIVYYDASVQPGVTNQYQVRGILNSNEETINTSRPISTGPFVKELPPKAIRIERKETGVEINWEPEQLRYYGVYVYRRSVASPEWQQINKVPRSIYKSKDQNGVDSYPPVFYEDTDVQKEQSYEYRLAVLDYFGQLSDYSETISVPVIDFEAPLPPLDLETRINVLQLDLSWTIQSSPDLAGFKVYRSSHADSIMRPIHDALLPKTQDKITDRLMQTGGYYYAVAATDSSGNEGMSQKIFIEVRDVTPPAPPKNVLISTDTGKVVVTWTANEEADIRGYYVYRSLPDDNNDNNEFIVMNKKPITEHSYTEVLPRNTRNKFVYAVVAEDLSLNRSTRSALSVVQLPDASSPVKPVIRNVSVLDNTLVVEWLPNPDGDLAGYDIYRSTDSLNFAKVNVNMYPASTFRYTDRDVAAGVRYFYYVLALDSAGNKSVPSNIFTGLNKKLLEENITPSDARVEYVKSRKEVRISWDLPQQQGLLGAVIFKSKDKVNFRPLTGLMKETVYTDKEVKSGLTYYYQVRSYASTGSVAISETLETIVKE